MFLKPKKAVIAIQELVILTLTVLKNVLMPIDDMKTSSTIHFTAMKKQSSYLYANREESKYRISKGVSI